MKGPTGMPSAGTTDHLREQRQRQSIEPIAMRVPEACRYLGIGRSTLYVLIGEGEVEVIKLRSSTLVLTESLRSLIERRRNPADNATSVGGE
jgi:excisionase family DNA binding protein